MTGPPFEVLDSMEPVLDRLKHDSGDASLLVAVSGGADSVALLDLLARSPLRGQLRVIHVNHGWRGPASTADETFVRTLAEGYAIPCEVVRLTPPTCRTGLEARARTGRYAAFAKVAARYGTVHVVLAHHRDDQVETVLMRLARGAGVRGLRGMLRRSVRHTGDAFPGGRRLILHRPLLEIGAEQIRGYLTARGLGHREDASNRDPAFLRNHLRHEVIPRLRRDLFANLDERTLELASLAQEITALARRRVQRCLVTPPPLWAGVALAVDRLREIPAVLVIPGLLELMAPIVETSLPRRSGLRVLDAWLRGGLAQSTSAIQLRADLVVRLEGKWLLVGQARREKTLERPRVLTIPGSIELPGWGRRLSARRVAAHETAAALQAARSDSLCAVLARAPLCPPLLVRQRSRGDRFRPLGAPGRRRLKKVLSEARLPRFQRDQLPIVTAGGEIVWVPGVGIAHHVALRQDGKRRADSERSVGNGAAESTWQDRHREEEWPAVVLCFAPDS